MRKILLVFAAAVLASCNVQFYHVDYSGRLKVYDQRDSVLLDTTVSGRFAINTKFLQPGFKIKITRQKLTTNKLKNPL